ncbi:MAG: hypothetical protein HYV97_11800 [Bdellovibrio sp.]|nr:hypothetical protein [Bdellovibrio sp.]
MQICKLIVLSLFLVNQNVSAHAPADSTDINETVYSEENGTYGRSYGGYGFLSTSEAEGAHAFQFQCRESDRQYYLEQFCRRTDDDGTPPVTRFLGPNMKNLVLTRLREQAAEYYAYQLNAVGGLAPRAPRLPRPACIPENSEIWTNLTGNGILARSRMLNASAREKRDAVNRTVDGENMSKALLYSKRLDHFMQKNTLDYNCATVTETNRQRCLPMQYTQYRLKSSFPALWRHNAQQVGSRNPGGFTIRSSETDPLFDHISTLIGANEAAGDDAVTTLVQAKVLGDQELQNGIQQNDDSNYTNLEAKFESAVQAGIDAPEGSLLKKAYTAYTEQVARVKSAHAAQMRSEFNCLCSGLSCPDAGEAPAATDDLNAIRILAFRRPNMVRQALLDMTPSERYLAQAVLCESNVLNSVKREKNCQGISGGPLPGATPVTVSRRKVNDWPYGSENHFNITRPETPADAPYTINLSINMLVGASLGGADANGDGIPDAMATKLQEWKRDTEGFLNCSTGQVANFTPMDSVTPTSCPNPSDGDNNPREGMQRIPGLKFNITMVPTTDPNAAEPLVSIHECYNMDVTASNGTGVRSNCNDVRELFLARCADRTPTPPAAQCVTDYNNRLATEPYRLDRANSGNYTLRSPPGVIRHEVVHLMGLADEYSSSAKPFSRLGEPDSLMNKSNSSSRLYPRHLDNILEPLQCVQGGES